MPTRRHRTSGGPAVKGAQSTLSFGGNKSKVAKTSLPTSLKAQKGSTKFLKKESPKAESPATEAEHTTPEAAVIEQAQIESSRPKSEAERQAENVTDAQIRRYWRQREKEQTERVHQEGLGVEEKILRYFDVSSQFGPCIGIGRMKRWTRANKLGLSPPIEVLAVLLKECHRGNSKTERAYIDELMTSTMVGGV